MAHQPFDWIVMTTCYTNFGQHFSYIPGLARAFSEQTPTVYVNPAIGWYQAWIKRECVGVLPDLSSDRLKVIQPYTWLSYGSKIGKRLNLRYMGRQISSHGSGRCLFWFHAWPEYMELARGFPNRIIVWSIGDEGEARWPLRYEMLKGVDYILAFSLPTFETFRSYFPDKTFYIPCGIDGQVYRDYHVWRQQGGMPLMTEIVEQTQYPYQVLYYGTVNDRINFALVYHLARIFPQCEFIFAGPNRVSKKRPHLERSCELPNLRFIDGLKPFDYIYLIEQSDACIVPYELNEFYAHAHPLKLYDYWMFAKPVVTTYIPTYRLYSDLLYMAEDFESFAAHLTTAIHEPNDQQRTEHRLAVASAHDTEKLAAATLEIISGNSAQSPDFYLQRIRETAT
ncbi:MAG: hypothetical protein ACE5JU_12700 [Candidatus Binatia bacterium]